MFGLNIIKQLLPHRAPFLMVDIIKSYTGGEGPAIKTEQLIHPDDPFFLNSEDPSREWPSIHILEGLGQSCNLLGILRAIELSYLSKGLKTDDMIRALGHSDMKKNSRETESFKKDFLRKFARVGMLASVDVEVTGHAKAGDLLCYTIKQTLNFGEFYHYSVNASLGKKTIIKGTMVGALGVN